LEIVTKNQSTLKLEINEEYGKNAYIKMLEFIYSGSINIESEKTLLLLKIASEYGMTSLKERCGLLLFNQVGPKNLTYLLEIAQQYSCSTLETKCAEYLANEFSELIKGESLYELPLSVWKKLLSQDYIKRHSEQDLFHAVLALANRRKESRIEILNELLPCIRFPFLSVNFLVDHVEKLQPELPLIEQLLYEAYRFKSCPKITKTNDRMKPRKGLLTNWSTTTKSSGITVNEESFSVQHTGQTSTWQSIGGTEYYSSGVHTWHIRIDSNISKWLFIGVVTKAWAGYNDQSNGYIGHFNDGWSYGSYSGWGKTHGQSNQQYGRTYDTGDVVSVRLNCEEKNLSFSLNDDDFGVAFQISDEPVCLAVTLYNNGDKLTLMHDYDGRRNNNN